MFYKTYIIFNLVDRATRWHAATEVDGKTSAVLIAALDRIWVAHHGPMQEFIMDGERAIAISDDAATYFRRKGIKLHIRAPGQHARIVERRHEVLRTALH